MLLVTSTPHAKQLGERRRLYRVSLDRTAQRRIWAMNADGSKPRQGYSGNLQQPDVRLQAFTALVFSESY